jgi:hypothetical protein
VARFVPGLQLSRQLYEERVRPILDARFGGLPHSAALLGRGSEVLGYDDATSTDHDWRARVLIFLSEAEQAAHGEDVDRVLTRELPRDFLGHPVDHRIHTVRGYVLDHLALDLGAPIEAADWLTLPEPALRRFTAGEVFHDEVGLQAARDLLAYYPRDVWLS